MNMPSSSAGWHTRHRVLTSSLLPGPSRQWHTTHTHTHTQHTHTHTQPTCGDESGKKAVDALLILRVGDEMGEEELVGLVQVEQQSWWCVVRVRARHIAGDC
jgi:hypothetical protein